MSQSSAEIDPKIARIHSWNQAKAALVAAIEYEMQLRKEVVAESFDSTKLKGTQNIEIGSGFKLKCVKKENIKVDKDKVNAALDEIEKIGQFGVFIAERVIKFTPDLSLTEWNSLKESSDPNAAKIIALLEPVLEFSPGSPTLEIVPPKLAV